MPREPIPATSSAYRKIWTLIFPSGLCAAIFLFVGVWAYWSVLTSFFLADDFYFLQDIHQHGVRAIWTIFPRDFFRPMVMASFWMDYSFWSLFGYELSPVGYHVTNLFLHGANTGMVVGFTNGFLMANEQPPEKNRWLAGTAGFLFLLHPSHTEAVSWISGRSDLLAAFWGMASLLAYCHHRKTGHFSILGWSWLFFFLALLSKESVVLFPFGLLALEWFFFRNGRRSGKNAWARVSGFFAVTIFVFFLRRIVLGAWIGGYGEPVLLRIDLSAWERNGIFYLWRSLFPVVSWPVHSTILTIGRLVIPFVGIWAIGSFLCALRKTEKRRTGFSRWILPDWLLALFGLYGFTLLPAINLGVHLGAPLGERFLYFPSVFFIFGFVNLVERIPKKWTYGKGCILVLPLLYGFALWQSNRTWHDAGNLSKTLLQDTLSIINTDKNNQTSDASLRLWILNVPDTLRGAYVYRNGLDAALNLFQKNENTPAVYPLVFQRLQTVNDRVQLIAHGDFQYELISTDPLSYFQRHLSSKNICEFLSFKRNRFQVKINSRGVEDWIFYFSEGHFHALP